MTRPSNALLISRSCSTPEAKAKRSADAAASWADPAVRAKRIAALKAANSDDAVRRRRMVAIKIAMRDPDVRRKCSNPHQKAKLAKVLQAAPAFRLPLEKRAEAAKLIVALAAFETALAAACAELGFTVLQARRNIGGMGAGRARALAIYLTVTVFLVPRRVLAEARGVDLRRLRRVHERIAEARSDDEALDHLLSRIEARLAQ